MSENLIEEVETEEEEELSLAHAIGLYGDAYGIMREGDNTCAVYETLEDALEAHLENHPAIFYAADDSIPIYAGVYKKVDDGYELMESRELGLGLGIQTKAGH